MEQLFDERRYLIPFRSGLLPQIFTDVLVIGAGVAGLRAAVAAAEVGPETDVIVLSKGDLVTTNTGWAQGGVAAARESGDSVESHARDTVDVGAGLCDEGVVRRVIEEGPRRIEELLSWGMRLDRTASGELAVGREGGHSASRIYHAGGDATGREMQRCMVARVRSLGNVRVFEGCFALDLITPSTEAGTPVMGAVTHHPKFGLQMIWARSTIVASGGSGQVFRETTNPRVATADGLALAYRAGAEIADAAFVQFHPTTLYLPGAGRSLISEAVRGEGAFLLDASGERFMLDEHPLGELAPRDVVSRAIVRQISRQGGRHVWLDCRHLRGFGARFPGIRGELEKFDLDPERDLIPVHPAAHYMIGGVRADVDGWTGVPGLLAVGEAACTGLHGANRLASNSLLEGLVCGALAGRAAAEAPCGPGEGAGNGRRGPIPLVSDIRPSDHGELDLADVRSSLRSAMWKNVGLERAGARLRDAMDMFNFWARYTLDKIFDEPSGWETQNMLLVASLVTRSALWRAESRGCHTRTDFEGTDPGFAAHDLWRRGREGPVRREVDVAGRSAGGSGEQGAVA